MAYLHGLEVLLIFGKNCPRDFHGGFQRSATNFIFLSRSLIFQKKFFWFGTEPVESKHLSSYLRGEKDASAANHNAAWASHTGKGLLFLSKKATDKASPAGVFNLVGSSHTYICTRKSNMILYSPMSPTSQKREQPTSTSHLVDTSTLSKLLTLPREITGCPC